MYSDNITPLLVDWQTTLKHAQALASSCPDTGLKPDSLALMTFDDLLGTLAFLKRYSAEREV